MPKTESSLLIFSTSNPLREGLNAFLSGLEHITIIGNVSTEAEALALMTQHFPQLVLLDMYGQHEATLALLQLIKARWPATRCCVLAESPAVAELARTHGAEAALVWGFQTEKLTAAIRHLAASADRWAKTPANFSSGGA